jgi:four helix bundle protein
VPFVDKKESSTNYTKQVKIEAEVEVKMYKSFKDMPIWINAMEIAVNIFTITDTLPHKEDYGFTSQIRRSALSISANIAEAFGRNHTADKINFYYFARGSITETQSHIEYGKKVGYLKENIANVIDTKLIEIYNDINKIIVSLKK